MKRIAILFLLQLTILNLQANSNKEAFQIIGQIIEKGNGKEIPYATATIQNVQSKIIQKISSDASGRFTLSVDTIGEYTLTLTAFGFTETKFPLDIKSPKTDIGAKSLEIGVAIKEVSVVAQKPLVRMEVDKITYSVESDPDAQTNNGLEILRKIPLLTVDGDENITLNGQSNYKVLVNGKSSSMMSSNFKEVIKSMPANTIKDIEVITNPSSKYEAEGVGGIINIITVKKTLNGFNGSISTGMDSYGGVNGSLYFASKINKFGFSASYFGNQYIQPESDGFSTNENLNSEGFRNSRTDYTNKYKGFSSGINGEASYEIDTFNLISLSFWGYSGNSESQSLSTTLVKDKDDNLSRYFENHSSGKNTNGTLSTNLDYQKTFMKPDKTFTISYKLDASPYSSDQRNSIENCTNYFPYHQKSISRSLGQEHTFQIDYYDPLTKMHQFECGIKTILRNNSSNSDQYRNDTLRTDQSNDLNYDQYILGAYAGYVFKLKNFTTKTGLRLERTWNNGVSTSDSVAHFTNRLFNVVPYITFSYQIKQGQTVKLSYTQRLQRPSIYYLNPYVNNSNPLDIRYGNPNLVSEISHSFETAYSLFTQNFNLNTSLSASINNNSIERVSSMNSLGITTTTFKNIGLNRRFNWNNYLSYRLGTKFSAGLNASVSYLRLEAHNGYNLSNDGFGFQGSLNIRKSLWKNAALSGNAMYSSPFITLQSKSSGYTYTSLALSQYFLRRKMSLNLSVSDPFIEKRRFMSNSKGVGYVSHYEGFYYTRNIRLSISYNFGKLESAVKKARRGISNDDVKSGGSSNGNGGGQ